MNSTGRPPNIFGLFDGLDSLPPPAPVAAPLPVPVSSFVRSTGTGSFVRPAGPVAPTRSSVPLAVPAPLTLEQRISGFLNLLNTTLTPKLFLMDISKQLDTLEDIIDYRHLLKDFPSSTLKYNVSNFSSGSYGRIKKVKSPQTGLVKMITFSILDPDLINDIRFFIKEVFIQYILNSDVKYKKHIPQIYGIYKKVQDDNITLYVHMQQALQTFYNARGDFTDFRNFYGFMKSLVKLMLDLNIDYKFAHRDFKTDNIVFMPADIPGLTNNYVGLIDFGFSTLTLQLEGENYQITNDSMYDYHVMANPRQDFGILLVNLYTDFITTFRVDDFISWFFETIFQGDEANPIIIEVKRRQDARGNNSLFHGAYNYNGLLTAHPESHRFSPEQIMNVLNQLADLYNIQHPTSTIEKFVLAGGVRRRRTIRRRRVNKRKRSSRNK